MLCKQFFPIRSKTREALPSRLMLWDENDGGKNDLDEKFRQAIASASRRAGNHIGNNIDRIGVRSNTTRRSEDD
jgi:hypothetical protein